MHREHPACLTIGPELGTKMKNSSPYTTWRLSLALQAKSSALGLGDIK